MKEVVPSGPVKIMGQHPSTGLVRNSPLQDEQGQQHAEERLRQENVALREEVDKASMFEEIVGTSRPPEAVVSRIAKVAPTDSTVLITGETGTGEELIAGAVHKRSQRSARPFISVNCAPLAPMLVSSELPHPLHGAAGHNLVWFLHAFVVVDGQKRPLRPSIGFTPGPPAAQRGRERVDTISGRVRNARRNQQIPIYAHSGLSWVRTWPPYLGS